MGLRVRTIAAAVAGSASSAPSVWRTVANNAIPQSDDSSGTRLSCAIRGSYIIGSGDVSEMRLSFTNAGITPAGGDKFFTNALDVDWCYVQANGVTVQVLFGGLPSMTIPAGASGIDVQSDSLLPSQFGLTSFARGSSILFRLSVTRPALENIPTTTTIQTGSDPTNSSVGWYDKAATTITNAGGTGVFTVTGTALSARTTGFRPILLGKYVSGDPKTVVIMGDSILQGLNDTTSSGGPLGIGYAARSCHDSGALTNFYSYINVAKGGSQYSDYQGSNIVGKSFYKYGKFAIDGMGTNDFGNAGTTQTAAAVYAKSQVFIAHAKAAGIQKIIRCSLLTRTSTSDGHTTEAGQTVLGTGWLAGGNVEQFHALISAGIGASDGYDTFVQFTSWKNATNAYKWITNGTTNYPTSDGTHPSNVVHGMLSDELRPVLTSI